MEDTDILRRFKKAVDEDRFSFTEKLGMVEHLVTKLKLISKSEYAKRQGVTPQGVDARLKSNNDPYLYVAGKYLIVP